MISRKAKYALKALVFLARQPKGKLSRTIDISKSAHIPKKFLEQILLELKRGGLVSSVQGNRGGYMILRAPGKINVADVLRMFDGPVALVPCVSLNFYERCRDCPSETKCSLHWSMAQVRDATLKVLKKHTILELCKHEGTT